MSTLRQRSYPATVGKLMRKSDKAPPSSGYFESMRRLRLEPPDEETVERILEIFRDYWRWQDSQATGELEG
jgi:hypothetical protein